MEFEITEKQHASTTKYYWLTLRPKGGGQDIGITVSQNTDHSTGYTNHEVTTTEGAMPGSEDDMETEENAIEYVKNNLGEILTPAIREATR